MVTSTHEALHRLFAEHPEALAPVYDVLGVPPPTMSDVREVTPDTTEIRPLERRVDTVLKVEPAEGEHYLLAIEAQSKVDPKKEANWAYYVAYLRAKYDLPVLLVAVCRERSTASWAAGPFECGVGPWSTQVTRPFVLGPQTVPEITDEAVAAQQPGMAVLSAVVHSDSQRRVAILETAVRGWLAKFDDDALLDWANTMEIGLENTPARDIWRKLLMAIIAENPGRLTFFQEKLAESEAEGKAKGMAEGESNAVLRVLEARSIAVSDDVRERVLSCTDLDRLDGWLDRSVTVTRAEDLFTEDTEDSEAPEA